jgi:Protein of unknown function (DUF2897)
MLLFWIFLVLVLAVILGNALLLLRTARPVDSQERDQKP